MTQPFGTHSEPTDEWDLPLGGLQQQARIKLERTHVEAAVAEVRFITDQTVLDQSVAMRVWDAMGRDTFTVFEPSTQISATVEFGPEGPVHSQEQIAGWLLATNDRATAITLLPSSIVVQTRIYDRYSSSLGAPLRNALEAFTIATGLSHIERIGLRYVNRLTDPAATTPVFWQKHIRAPFLGPLAGRLGTLATDTHQQAGFRFDDFAGARVQTGVFEEQVGSSSEPQYSYLIDLDVFRNRASLYDPQQCANEVRQLNRTALALFADVLTDQYLTDLGPAPLAPGQ